MACQKEEERDGIRALGMRISRKVKLDDYLLAMGAWKLNLVFPDVSHSYCSQALLPLPFGLHIVLAEKTRTCIYTRRQELQGELKRKFRLAKSSEHRNMEESMNPLFHCF
ncbi:hypothetical protein PVAP13_1KG220100 [Panicum virgatum]|uniref:Uncharacterized protein n=1 Tax=Panicum virgatum TaxID=38727 RepID=A0A8T0XEE7_PANVG|nr:hypothetical protein PVAP13_1KG220100 [Panicum virgatum]